MGDMGFPSVLLLALSSLSLVVPSSSSLGSDLDLVAHPRFICTPVPVDADPACFPAAPGAGATGSGRAGHQSPPPAGWWGAGDEAKATILHLRESLVQHKETILDQRETIRELTAKLNLCEGFRRTPPHQDHHGAADTAHPHPDHGRHGEQVGHHGNANVIPDPLHHPSAGHGHTDGGQGNSRGKDKHETHGDGTPSPQQMEQMLQVLKERLDSLQLKRNTSATYAGSLKELLQRKINDMEQRLHHYTATLSGQDHHPELPHDDHHGNQDHDQDREQDRDHDRDYDHDYDHEDGRDHSHGERGNDTDHHNDDHEYHDLDGDHDEQDNDHHNEEESRGSPGYPGPDPQGGYHSNKLDVMFSRLHHRGSSRNTPTHSDAFQLSFPMRTNYMYGRAKKTLLHEIFALTLCLWIKAGAGPGLGTPFSYSAPGQVNELVLIEWGNNPMELLVDDQAVTLPLSLSDGKWHHVCVTWSTRHGQWGAFQDGVLRGSGTNLSAWHPIKPGGVFILGQEQDVLGGRFDATQSFVGEMADLQVWSQVLSHSDIYSLASCGSHLTGDVIAWSDSEWDLHGGVPKMSFDPCQ